MYIFISWMKVLGKENLEGIWVNLLSKPANLLSGFVQSPSVKEIAVDEFYVLHLTHGSGNFHDLINIP